MEIKLTNVARASLEELLADYQDFLRSRRLKLWARDDARLAKVRKLCREPSVTYETYAPHVERGESETAANTIICLEHQTNYLLDQQIRQLEQAFLKEGGLRERMTRARLKERNRQGRE